MGSGAVMTNPLDPLLDPNENGLITYARALERKIDVAVKALEDVMDALDRANPNGCYTICAKAILLPKDGP
jgi:hypothetical protein